MSRTVLRDAVRSLTREPSFSIAAIALLSVTIASVLAVYAMVSALVLRPLPFRDQDRLYVIWQRDDRRALPVVEVALGEMRDWRSRTRSFQDLAVVGSVNWSLTLAGRTEPESIPIAAASASFFDVTGVEPSVGRRFTAAEEDGASPQVMVISHGLWLRRYGGDRAVIGRAVPIRLDAGRPNGTIEIVGVMPPGFDFPRGAEAWVPAAPLVRHSVGNAAEVDNALRWLGVFFVVGRTRPEVTREEAAGELTRVMRTADRRDGPEPNQVLVVTPIADYLLGPAKPVLWALLGGVALMLAGACANVAGLQLARQARRQRALAVRVALGASRRALFVQAGMESALVTACALALAGLLAPWLTRLLAWLAPADVPRLQTVSAFNFGIVAAAAGVWCVVMLIVGLWPAFAASRVDAVRVLAHGAGGTPSRARWMGRGVVVAQVAVALTLFVGMALFVRTLAEMRRAALGFDPDRLLALTVTPQTDDLDRWNASYSALIARVAALPDVVSVSAVQLRPLSGPIGWESQPILPGQVPAVASSWGLNPLMNLQTVTPGYFQTMGIRLRRGRVFTAADDGRGPGVVIVSESTAQRLWPGRDALGQRLVHYSYRADVGPGEIRWQTVIGVVEDVRYRGLADVRLDCYMPAAQSKNRVQYLMVRAGGDPAAVGRAVRAAADGPGVRAAVSDATSMTEAVARESAPWRFLMRLFVAFAAVAGLLAGIGLGSVIALSVAGRRKELAIRAALGADRARLRGVILREGLVLTAMGLAAGLACALALGRTVAHVLVGVDPHDPLSIGIAASISASVALLASWWPARRAATADPAEVLRAE